MLFSPTHQDTSCRKLSRGFNSNCKHSAFLGKRHRKQKEGNGTFEAHSFPHPGANYIPTELTPPGCTEKENNTAKATSQLLTVNLLEERWAATPPSRGHPGKLPETVEAAASQGDTFLWRMLPPTTLKALTAPL